MFSTFLPDCHRRQSVRGPAGAPDHGRPKILVFNGCYHGSVDETIIELENGVAVPRRGNIGPAVSPADTTRVVEFNDLAALEEALSHGDVACVLTEPALTNIGIGLPIPAITMSCVRSLAEQKRC